MTRLRLHFWLFVLDGICIWPRGFGSRAYEWALQRASDAADWGPPLRAGDGDRVDV